MKGDAFVKLPRTLLESEAWRSLSINARRFLDFLMIEYMRHGGRANGKLLAPWRQLEKFGIAHRHIATAIEEAERAGLVDCRRGVGRAPSIYALTWLPLNNGTESRWRASNALKHRGDGYVVGSEGNSLHVGSEGNPLEVPKGTHKARSGFRREPTRLGSEGNPLSRKTSYQGGADSVERMVVQDGPLRSRARTARR